MKGLFTVAVVQEDNGGYVAEVRSLLDTTKRIIRAKNLGLLMKRVSGKINARAAYNRKFPPPKPSLIIKPGDPGTGLIVPARN